MFINEFANDINLSKKDFLFLSVIILFTLFVIVNRIKFYNDVGIQNSDVFVYIWDSLYFAGINYNNIGDIYYIFNSPTICFLTSLIFRCGYVDKNAIFIVTGFIELLGIICLYILLKFKFSRQLSFIGAMLYAGSRLVLLYIAAGMLDIPATSMCIFIILFSVLAVDKNPKYYLIAGPLFVFGLFTRITVIFILPPLVLYLLTKYDVLKSVDLLFYSRKDFVRNLKSFLKGAPFKYFMISAIISAAIFIIVVMYISKSFDTTWQLFDAIRTTSEGWTSKKGADQYYNEDCLYYFRNFEYFLINNYFKLFNVKIFHIFYAIIGIGFVITIINAIKGFKITVNNNYFLTRNYEIILKCLILLFLIVFVVGLKINYLISLVSIFFVFLIMLSFLNKYSFNRENYSLFILMFSWMIFYLTFISFINVKGVRYFVPVLIPLIYMMLYFLQSLITAIGNVLKNNNSKNLFLNVFTVFFVVLILISAYASLEQYSENYDNRYHEIEDVSDFLMNYDSEYYSKNITTDGNFRYYDWFLQMNNDHIVFYDNVSVFDSTGSDYLILSEEYNFENYTEIYNKGDIYLYEHI